MPQIADNHRSEPVTDPIFAVLLDSPPPAVGAADAVAVLNSHWGIGAAAEGLACERDTSFRMRADDGRIYVLKFANPA
ncbi:MAG TPA: hypothetical protein VGC31_03785, partial [Paenirhodobacter sp.]